jgi:hypothetical protein
MSVVSQWFSRTSNAGSAPVRENNVVSLGGAIGARGLPPCPDLRPCKSLTCSDAMRTGPNGRHRDLLRLTECSHHVGSSGFAALNGLVLCSVSSLDLVVCRLVPGGQASYRAA